MLEPMQRCDELAALLAHNHRLQAILSRAPELELDAYYLAAGAIVQTVWNVQSSRPADAGIDDYDLVYEEHFGNAIEPYRSVEHAIDTFPTIVTSIGVRRNANASLHGTRLSGSRICSRRSSVRTNVRSHARSTIERSRDGRASGRI